MALIIGCRWSIKTRRSTVIISSGIEEFLRNKPNEAWYLFAFLSLSDLPRKQNPYHSKKSKGRQRA
jgi:hypothetical protein